MPATKLIVVSDLHISAGALDDFDGELEGAFLRFLDEVGVRGEGTELVINGDFLDFVQAPPWEGDDLESEAADTAAPLCFSQAQSVEKLEAIGREHAQVFAALGRFLAVDARNRVVLMPGNHDPDLFWPDVRQRLRGMVQAGSSAPVEDRVVFHLERAYRPEVCPAVWVEHGHQFDPVNSFFDNGQEIWAEEQPPLNRDETGVDRLWECLGTRFLIRFLNRLDREYPFVDNVKPFSLFVKTFATSAFASGSASLRAAATVWRLLAYLARTGVTEPGALMSVENRDDGPTELLLQRLEESARRTPRLQSRLHEAGFMPHLPLAMVFNNQDRARQLVEFVASRPELLDGLEAADDGLLDFDGREGMLTLRRGFSVDESRQLAEGAEEILEDPSVEVVIMGHTHERQDRPDGRAYLNTGSWTRYYKQREGRNSWAVLRDGSYEDFPYQLLYAAVDTRHPSKAKLELFAEKNHG